MRITFRMLSRGPLRNIFNSLERLTELQVQAGSNKRFQVPSDDPVSVMKVMGYKALLKQNENFANNVVDAGMYIDTIDSTLRSVKDLLDSAKAIALEQRSATATAETRRVASIEIKGMISDVKDLLNIKFNGKYIFGGHRTQIEPFQEIGGAIRYQGDEGSVKFRIGPSRRIDVTIPGSRFLSMGEEYVDNSITMSPDVTSDTLLSDLNNGDGVRAGRFQITDGDGNTAVIDTTGATTVRDVLDRINHSVPPLNLIAGVTSSGDAIAIQSMGSGEITVTDLDGGSAAADLGIAKTSSGGLIVGDQLNPVLSENTKLMNVDSLKGIILHGINVNINGGSYHVDFINPSYVQTVKDMLDRIMEAVPGLNAQINETRDGIVLSSEIPFSVGDSGSWSTATDLGLDGEAISHGPYSLFGTLESLENALVSNDPEALDDIIGEIDGVAKNLLEIVAEVGARGKEVEIVTNRLEDDRTKLQRNLSSIEEIDLSDVLTRLSQAQVVYQAALKTASQIYQLSLLNFS
ncbi:MAG: flagellar hook-associated protein 3 [Candidatus Latescibacteria bacterium 4484_7]|nr:MAG: flagellar hook-associated protein 3 [Candidatus Latescibacteria bacterium 4484_7]